MWNQTKTFEENKNQNLIHFNFGMYFLTYLYFFFNNYCIKNIELYILKKLKEKYKIQAQSNG